MNKWEKEVQQSLLDSEAAAIKELEKQYAAALKDINEKVKLFQADIDLLDQALSQDGLDDATKALLKSQKQSKVYQKQYQQALKGQVSSIIDKMHSDHYTTIDKYLNGCYETAYIGTMYDIAKQGVPIIAPIDQAAAVKAVLTDSKIVEGYYNHLGVNYKKLKKTITQEVSRGIASGLPYRDIARNINNVSGSGLSNAKRIARTEGHRIQQTSSRDAQYAAKKKGANVVKQWDAALDKRTRDSHARVDGEIRELDEKFSNGLMFPGDPSGSAAEVINCRCTSNTRARWALDDDELNTLKDRAAYFGLDKTKNFEDFKGKYLKAVDNSEKSDRISSIKKSVEIPDDLEYLLKADTNFANKDVDVKVLQTINNSISSRKAVRNDFDFNEIKIAKFPTGDKSVFITDYEVFGGKQRTRLYLNTEFFTGQTAEQLDMMCLGYYEAGWWKSKSVGDLVNHEIMHARINYNNSFEKVERLYGELKEDTRTKGFCRMVDTNPEEFLNEMYVAMCNGEIIDSKYVDVFNEYTKEFLGG